MNIEKRRKKFKTGGRPRASIAALVSELVGNLADRPNLADPLLAVAELTGMDDPNVLSFHNIAFQDLNRVVDHAEAILIADLMTEWLRHKNSHMIDFALFRCLTRRIMPPPILTRVVLKDFEQRFRSKGTAAASVVREVAEAYTFKLMLRIIYSGVSLKQASSKAAKYYASNFPTKQKKASSWEKAYVRKYRSIARVGGKTLEEMFFLKWDAVLPRETRQQWRESANKLPEADEKLKGSRR